MAKKFIQITQTWRTTAIIDIPKGETEEETLKRIKSHIENNGGPETIICLGGEIEFSKMPGTPTSDDEDSYECID